MSTLEAHNKQQFAKRLAFILGHENVSDDYTNAIESILCEAFNAAGLSIYSPEFIEMSYPILLDGLNGNYSAGIDDAITAIMDSIERNDDDLAEEIQKRRVPYSSDVNAKPKNLEFAERLKELKDSGYDGKLLRAVVQDYTEEMRKAVDHGRICTPERMAQLYPIFREINLEEEEAEREEELYRVEELSVLDLSSHGENLNILDLAQDLSKVMKNPLLPRHIYNVIHEELTTVGADTDGVEWILANLKGEES